MSCSILVGTHDLHNISVHSPSPGVVEVTGYLVDESSTVGILIIVYSVTEDIHVYYNFVPHEPELVELRVYAVAMGLPDGQYEVAVYVMEESGLPFSRSAARSESVWINGNLLAN